MKQCLVFNCSKVLIKGALVRACVLHNNKVISLACKCQWSFFIQ